MSVSSRRMPRRRKGRLVKRKGFHEEFALYEERLSQGGCLVGGKLPREGCVVGGRPPRGRKAFSRRRPLQEKLRLARHSERNSFLMTQFVLLSILVLSSRRLLPTGQLPRGGLPSTRQPPLGAFLLRGSLLDEAFLIRGSLLEETFLQRGGLLEEAFLLRGILPRGCLLEIACV